MIGFTLNNSLILSNNKLWHAENHREKNDGSLFLFFRTKQVYLFTYCVMLIQSSRPLLHFVAILAIYSWSNFKTQAQSVNCFYGLRASVTSACLGEPFELSVMRSGGVRDCQIFDVEWYRDGVLLTSTSTSITQQIDRRTSFEAKVTYGISRTRSSSFRETSTYSLDMDVNPHESIFAGPDITIGLHSMSEPVALTGSDPVNGTWAGNGIQGNTNRFDPAAAGLGSHTITFTAANRFGCTQRDSRVITVLSEGIVADSVERHVLTNLYNDMGGPGWLRQQGWLEAENLADWQGVVVENGDVSRLDLSNNNLMNALPLYLEQLAGLKELVLYANRDISSPLPSTLGNLSNLELLDLSNCSLGDTVPGNMLSKLTWLRQLRLDANQFTGEIPMDLGKLTSLQVLTLGFNDLEGEIPRSFSQLQSLQVFSLSQNFRLGGDITPWLTAFPMIRVFDVAFNNFVGYLPEALKDMTTLSNLILNSNDLSGTIPDDLFENVPISTLNLNDNHFNGPIPRSVLKSGLASLNLGNNEFEGDIADGSYDWDQLTDLTHLVLEDNKLTGKILEKGWSFGENLEWLSLAYNNFYGKIGLSPAQLANLRFVFLQGNEFTDISAVCPAPYDCSDLVLMNVSDNLLELKKLVTGLGLSVNSSGNIVPTSDGVNGLQLSPQKASLYFNRKKQSLFITGEWNLDHHIPQYQWFKDYVTLTNPTDEIEVPAGEDYNSYSSTIRYNGVNNFVVRSLPAVEVDSANMYWAIADGNWTDRIWSRVKNGVPTHDHPKRSSDNVVIADHNVTLSSEVDCAELKLVAETDSTSLTVENGKITVYGDVMLTKERPELIGKLKVGSGGKVIPLGASAQR